VKTQILTFAILISSCVAAFSAVSFIASNPPEMTPLTNHNSPAYHAAKLFRRGVNLGNYLEVPPGQKWSVTISPDDFSRIRREGFDHIRVPIGWHHYAGAAPEFALSDEIFSRVDFVVTNAFANHLAVLINIHHFEKLDRDPAGATDEFVSIWRQIAAHYEKFPATLAFELDNEPHGAATTALMNPIYARAIAEIRKTNPHRTIFVEPGNWGSIDELKNLVLPPDENVIVSVHCYEPFYFTHQGATWAGADLKILSGIVFPGPPDKPLVLAPALKPSRPVTNWIARYNTLPTEKNPSSAIAFESKLQFAHEWSEFYGRPVHVGEFGCYTKADADSRARFYAAFRSAAEKENLGWAIWDWNAGFRYWDSKKNEPMPGMREALFEK
jgi:endoglucanase